MIRIMYNANYLDHAAPLYLKLNILQFPDILNYFTGIFMLNAFQNTLPSSLQYLFTISV